jgi:hypothetical protein
MINTIIAFFVAIVTAVINLIHPEPRFEPDGYDQ